MGLSFDSSCIIIGTNGTKVQYNFLLLIILLNMTESIASDYAQADCKGSIHQARFGLEAFREVFYAHKNSSERKCL